MFRGRLTVFSVCQLSSNKPANIEQRLHYLRFARKRTYPRRRASKVQNELGSRCARAVPARASALAHQVGPRRHRPRRQRGVVVAVAGVAAVVREARGAAPDSVGRGLTRVRTALSAPSATDENAVPLTSMVPPGTCSPAAVMLRGEGGGAQMAICSPLVWPPG